MNTKQVREPRFRSGRGFAGPAAVLVAALWSSTATADAPAPKRGTANFEVRFIERMIDHHAMAVEMSEICLDKAIHDDLRDLCQTIIDTQTSEIELMQSWLGDWYGISHEPEMKPRDERQLEELQSLGGEEFEIAFLEDMIEHHEIAIRRGEQCTVRAFHDELLDLCEGIVDTQSVEVETMEGWLCQWYGICDRRS